MVFNQGMSHHHDHDHHHEHAHAPEVDAHNQRKVLLSFFLIFSYMLVEVAGGVLSGSLALLADAGHMLTDAAALGLAWAAFRFGRRAADSRRTFGYLRFEVLAGFINALTLMLIVGWIAWEAYRRFTQPHDVLSGPMMAVAVVGLLINLLVLWIITRGDTEHVNIKGAILHVMGDLLGSVGAIVAALVIWLTGWMPIDPILSVLVALLILRSAWALLRKSMHILLEGAPEGALPEDIEAGLLAAVPRLAAVHHIHVWQLTSGKTLATLHVRPMTDDEARPVTQAVDRILHEQFNVEHATIAIDWNADDSNSACVLQADSIGNSPQNAYPHAS